MKPLSIKPIKGPALPSGTGVPTGPNPRKGLHFGASSQRPPKLGGASAPYKHLAPLGGKFKLLKGF